jgi:adenine-specific DNA-methyltransferase
MDNLRMESQRLSLTKLIAVAKIFPSCITEIQSGDGTIQQAIDFDLLRQELGDNIVEGPQERYRLDWPGRRRSLALANRPTNKTLRPSKEDSVDFETTRNLYIEGDNLEVIKLLQETYLSRVKLIYIDPPYNTGKNFIYSDKFSMKLVDYKVFSGEVDSEKNIMFDEEKWRQNSSSNGRFHSEWLSMLYPRLKLARNLLRDDGVIFISIDDGEVSNTRKMCDEIFGEANFVTSIAWEKRYSPQNAVKWFSESHDFIIVYAKNKDQWHPHLLERSDEMNARYRNPDNDPRGPWKPADSTAQGGHGTPSQFYTLKAPNGKTHVLPSGRCWVYTESVFNEKVADNRIWFGVDGNNVPAVKRFLSEVKQGTACQTIWKYGEVGHNQEGTKEIKKLFPEGNVFDTPKPVRLLKRILDLSTDPESIILDFFSGSATTAHAVMQKNAEDGGKRRHIMVQLPEPCDANSQPYQLGFSTISEIGKERIRRAGNAICKELQDALSGKLVGSEEYESIKNRLKCLDTGFRVLKLDSSNMKDVYYAPDEIEQSQLELLAENIKADRNAKDLLFQVLVDWGVDLSLQINQETIQERSVFFVDENALAACFEADISEDCVKEIAKREPLRAVFRDCSFGDDSSKINVEQIFRLFSPTTELRSI